MPVVTDVGVREYPKAAGGTRIMAIELEIGGYNTDSRMLTVRITRRSSRKSVWAALKDPAIVGRGWWIIDFSLDEPPNWPDMAAPAEQ